MKPRRGHSNPLYIFHNYLIIHSAFLRSKNHSTFELCVEFCVDFCVEFLVDFLVDFFVDFLVEFCVEFWSTFCRFFLVTWFNY